MKKDGFTLIEIIVVVAILAIVGATVLFGMSFFQNKSKVEAMAKQIVTTLRLAQNKTLASEGDSSYGVHFESDKLTLFKGTVYVAGASDNSVYKLSSDLEISDISLGGGADIVFDRLTGTTANAGSVKIYLTSDSSKNEVIYIDGSGTVSLQSGGASDDNRIKDSRHTHVLYSQDTRSAVSLVLNFPNDSFSQNIAYQTYLDPGKTEFFWQGSVTVGGLAQQLEIHSHRLDAASVLFCIHRDGRYNNKALQISLDGQNIINYSAAGVVSAGTSIWAGAPEVQ